jgi:hypothetical protein
MVCRVTNLNSTSIVSLQGKEFLVGSVTFFTLSNCIFALARWAQNSHNHSAQLLVLTTEASHVLHASLEAFVGRLHSPDHFQMLVSLFLHNISVYIINLVSQLDFPTLNFYFTLKDLAVYHIHHPKR